MQTSANYVSAGMIMLPGTVRWHVCVCVCMRVCACVVAYAATHWEEVESLAAEMGFILIR